VEIEGEARDGALREVMPTGGTMWVANICFERMNGIEKTYVTCGKLWHNGHRGFVRMALFPMTAYGPHGLTLFANAFNDNMPYIRGDIIAEGNFRPGSTVKKEWVIGFIYTETNAHGHIQYIIVMFADPWPVFSTRTDSPAKAKYGEGVILGIKEDTDEGTT